MHADYRVVVVTGDDEEAGTDSHVFITLFGKTGASPKLELKKPDGETEPAFQAGSSDEFVMRCNNVGPLKKIRCASLCNSRVSTLFVIPRAHIFYSN